MGEMCKTKIECEITNEFVCSLRAQIEAKNLALQRMLESVELTWFATGNLIFSKEMLGDFKRALNSDGRDMIRLMNAAHNLQEEVKTALLSEPDLYGTKLHKAWLEFDEARK